MDDFTCGLGPYRGDLVEAYWRWEQDPSTLIGYGQQVPQSLEARTEGMRHQLAGSNVRFTIYDTADEKPPVPVGVATLLPDHSVRTAEFVILIAPEARGRGMAARATRLTLDYGFHVSAFRMIWLKVLAPNVAAIRSYEKAGFKQAGTLRQAGYWRGKVCDELVMDALAEEFTGVSLLPKTPTRS
ncbi:GNAT family N-acetyltransferase [Kitasatospora sp. NPDC056184]|uniref:GNAT family N-acetyltransferase n=1 Tax=Kitasatospora sp. NPDC056184 TaxID=3345738 RepID=UPI0035E0FCBB